MFFAISTFASLQIGWNLGMSHGTWPYLWILLGGTGRLLDIVFDGTLANRPRPPEEKIYSNRITRVPISRTMAKLRIKNA